MNAVLGAGVLSFPLADSVAGVVPLTLFVVVLALLAALGLKVLLRASVPNDHASFQVRMAQWDFLS